MSRALPVAFAALFAAAALSAPTTKDKPDGPATAEQLAKSAENLRLILLAMHVGNDAVGSLPVDRLGKDKKPLLSWRVQLLPHLEFDGETVPALGGMFDGRFHAAFADGTVKRFRKDAPAETLKLLICPNDGNVLPEDIGLDEGQKR